MPAAAPVAKPTPRRPEPTFYVFMLTQKFDELYTGSSPYQARLDLPTTDTILWPYINGQAVGFDDPLDEAAEFYPRAIRYVAGANSIFVDEQERNSEAYKLDNNGRNRLL